MESNSKTIENSILNPEMPFLYKVSGITKAVYSKNQLQLISIRIFLIFVNFIN